MVAYCQQCRQRRCVGCLTGFLGCRCRGYEQASGNSTLCDVFWLLFFFGTSLYIWFWFYYWLLAENSMDLMNGYAYKHLGMWFPFYFVMLALTCVALAYVLILFMLLLFHFIVDFQLYIHWIHRVILVVILLMSVMATVGLDIVWSEGWRLMYISLMITAPFLHISAVVVATLLSWFVAGHFMRCYKKRTLCGLILVIVYVVVVIALYISPLAIKSPCIVEKSDLPSKPLLLAHKGASAIAPENTMIAFEDAADNDVLGFESDVIISYDGVPFLLHDPTFQRTTNIADVFPKWTDVQACWLNMSEIKQLDAGSWFLKDDPFGTVRSLSGARRKLYANQTVPTLKELLQLAVARNVSVMFDIKALDGSLCKGHPYEDKYGQVVVDTIHQLVFPNDKMWWLYYKSVNATTSFRFVSADVSQSADSLHNDSATTVNFAFTDMMWHRVLYYLKHKIWVNIYTVDAKWLYSLYWCMNVTSITTNRCHEFAHMTSPVWHMAPDVYLTVWIAADCASAVFVVLFCIIQRILHRRVEVDSDSYSLQPAPTATSTYRPETMHQQLLNVENC